MNCNSYSSTDEYNNQQIKCFSPEIPFEDRIYFTTDVYFEISLIYYMDKITRNASNKMNIYNEIRCDNLEDCKIIYSNNFKFMLKSIEPAIIKPDETITIRYETNSNILNYFREIKVIFI